MVKTTYMCDRCGKEVKCYYTFRFIHSHLLDVPDNLEICEKCYRQFKKWIKNQEKK